MAISAESGGATIEACLSPPGVAEAGEGGPCPKTAATASCKVGGAEASPSNENDIEEDIGKPRAERMAAEGSRDAKPPSTCGLYKILENDREGLAASCDRFLVLRSPVDHWLWGCTR